MALKHFFAFLALLLLGKIVIAQEAAPSPQAVPPAPPAVAEEADAAKDNLAEQRAKELQLFSQRLSQLSSRLRDQANRVPPESLKEVAEEQAALVRRILRMEPLPVDTQANLYLMIPIYMQIKNILIDKPVQGILSEKEQKALQAEYRAAATALVNRAHQAYLREGKLREAERLRGNAAYLGVPAETVASWGKEAGAVEAEALAESFHRVLDMQHYDLVASWRTLKEMEGKGADAKVLRRMKAEYQTVADGRLLAKARLLLHGEPPPPDAFQNLLQRAEGLGASPEAMEKLKTMQAEAAVGGQLRRQFMAALAAGRLESLHTYIDEARRQGASETTLAQWQAESADAARQQCQRNLWAVLGQQSSDYANPKQMQAAWRIVNAARQYGVDKAALAEWEQLLRQVQDERTQRLLRNYLWANRPDEAEALLREAEADGMEKKLAVQLRQELQETRREGLLREFWRAIGKHDAQKAEACLAQIEKQGIAKKAALSEMRGDLRDVQIAQLEDEYRLAVAAEDEAKAEEVLNAARAINVPEETLRHWHDAFHPKRRY